MVDIYRIAKQRGKYPPRLTDTEVSSCYRIKISDITRKKKDDFNSFIPAAITIF